MGEYGMSLSLVNKVRDNRLSAPIRYDDDYIEKMGRFYTSESFGIIYPQYKEIGFKEWLDKVYIDSVEGVTRYGE